MRAALDNDRDQCQTLHQVLLTSRLISFISTSKTLNILALNVIFTTFRKQHCVEWVQSQDFKTPFILKKKIGLKRKVGVGFPQVFNNPGPKIFYDIQATFQHQSSICKLIDSISSLQSFSLQWRATKYLIGFFNCSMFVTLPLNLLLVK